MGIPDRDSLSAMIETLYGQFTAPAVVSNECGTVTSRPVEEIIEAIRYLESKHGVAKVQPASGLENRD